MEFLTIFNTLEIAKIKVAPPSSEDRTFGGSVTFRAIMDQKGFDDVRDGTFNVRLINL